MGPAGEMMVNLVRGTMTPLTEEKSMQPIRVDTRHVWLFRLEIN